MQIDYKIGNALEPEEDRVCIIHCCNNKKTFGAGIARSIKEKWPHVYESHTTHPTTLGTYRIVNADKGIWIANIIGQEGIGPDAQGNPPVRYDALFKALDRLALTIEAESIKNPDKPITVVGPRLGCGLAGGYWEVVESIINVTLIAREIPVVIYDLPN